LEEALCFASPARLLPLDRLSHHGDFPLAIPVMGTFPRHCAAQVLLCSVAKLAKKSFVHRRLALEYLGIRGGLQTNERTSVSRLSCMKEWCQLARSSAPHSYSTEFTPSEYDRQHHVSSETHPTTFCTLHQPWTKAGERSISATSYRYACSTFRLPENNPRLTENKKESSAKTYIPDLKLHPPSAVAER
jgi:hypothetical protein